MTVAAGFVCKGGIVLCADSQETAGDYKFPVEKVVTKVDPWTEIAIAGSGTGPLVDMATEQLAKGLLGGHENYTAVEGRLGDVLNELYETPFRLYPVREAEDSVVQLLIAVKVGKMQVPILYQASATAISRVTQYAIIGSGRAVQYEVQQLYTPEIGMAQGILIAVQLMNVAKAVLSSVGGTGRIVTLEVGEEMGVAGDWEMIEAEKAVRRFNEQLSSLRLDFANLEIGDDTFAAMLQRFVKKSLSNRHEYRQKANSIKELTDFLLNPERLINQPEKTEPEQ